MFVGVVDEPTIECGLPSWRNFSSSLRSLKYGCLSAYDADNLWLWL